MTVAVAMQAQIGEARANDVACDGLFTGHAAIFGVEDLARDIVEPGAFAASLSRRGASGVRMLWHHDPTEPIGRWLDIREDARGLFVRGRISTAVNRGREVLALLHDGALDGLSIGFRTVRGRRDRRDGIRRLVEVDLWEISLVTFPMQPGARVVPPRGDATVAPSVGLAVRSARRSPDPSASEVSSPRLVDTIRRAASLVRSAR